MANKRVFLVLLVLVVLLSVAAANQNRFFGNFFKKLSPATENEDVTDDSHPVSKPSSRRHSKGRRRKSKRSSGGSDGADVKSVIDSGRDEEGEDPAAVVHDGKIHRNDLIQLAAASAWVVYDDTTVGIGDKVWLPNCYGPFLRKEEASQDVVSGNDWWYSRGHIYHPQKRRILIVSIRGTDSDVDWKANMKGVRKKKYVVPTKKDAGKSSSGWVKIFRDLYKELGPALEADLKKYKDENPILLITGHSLGGVLATMLMASIAEKRRPVMDNVENMSPFQLAKEISNDVQFPDDTFLITFGSPQVGDENLIHVIEKGLGCSDKVARIVARRNSFPKQDVVSRLQLFNGHYCKPILLNTGDVSVQNNHRLPEGYITAIFGPKGNDVKYIKDPIRTEEGFEGDGRFSSKVCQTTQDGYNAKGKDYDLYQQVNIIDTCYRTFYRKTKEDDFQYKFVMMADGKCKKKKSRKLSSMWSSVKRWGMKGYCEAAGDCKSSRKKPCQGYCSCSVEMKNPGQCYCVQDRPGSHQSWCRKILRLKAQSTLKRIFSFE